MSQKELKKSSNVRSGYTRPKIVQSYYGFSPATYWRKIKNGTFPKPIKLSAGISGNKNSDLDEYEKDPENYKANTK